MMQNEGAQSFYLAGIGGVGMSALAEWLHAKGHCVRGSDRDPGQPALNPLATSGIQLVPQDGQGPRKGDTFVYSTAVEEDNPDRLRAVSLGLRMVHRARLISERRDSMRLFAVAGTAGKTTTAAMLGWILEQAGMDPDVLIGGVIPAWRAPDRLGAARSGEGGIMVLEVDESDRSLLAFHPRWAVIGNVGEDHFALPETIELFSRFASEVKDGLILGPGVELLLSEHQRFREGVRVQSLQKPMFEDAAFTLNGQTVSLRVPGRHNALNALVACQCALHLGVDMESAGAAMATFSGVHRRLEHVGRWSRMDLYDDYAHNPMKIRAAIETLQARCDRLAIFWRPHGFGPLRSMFESLRLVFSDLMRSEDSLFLLPVFDAGGTADRSIHSEDLATALRNKDVQVQVCRGYEALETELATICPPPQIVLGMGARDYHIPEFLRRLSRLS